MFQVAPYISPKTLHVYMCLAELAYVSANLSQVRAHGIARGLRVTPDNAFKNTLVMDLPSLRPPLNVKDLLTLLTQQFNNRVYKHENKGILGFLPKHLGKTDVG